MSNETLTPFSQEARELKGVFEHYSGRRYEIVGVSRHSETLEEMVVYRALYGDRDMWVRPLSMFLESVEIKGVIQPRFRSVKG
jgi:hypothetical protein